MLEDLDNFGMPIFEMANIIPKDHGLGLDIRFHVLQPGDKGQRHGPNVKPFRGDFKTTDMKFSVALPSLEIRNGSFAWLSKKEFQTVMNFIELNMDSLLKLYNDPGLSPGDFNWIKP